MARILVNLSRGFNRRQLPAMDPLLLCSNLPSTLHDQSNVLKMSQLWSCIYSKGTDQQIQHAQQLIREKIEGERGGGGNNYNQGQNWNQPGWNQQPQQQQQQQQQGGWSQYGQYGQQQQQFGQQPQQQQPQQYGQQQQQYGQQQPPQQQVSNSEFV